MGESASNSLTLYIAAWPLERAVVSARSGEPSGKAVKSRVPALIPAQSGLPTLLSFSAPDYGIMFRCRVVCKPAEAVGVAAVTGLRFLEVSLKDANIKQVTLGIDSPSYYFKITGQTTDAIEAGGKAEMLRIYREKYELDFKLIERVNNPARHNCHALPTTPADVKAPLIYSPAKWSQKGKMMPLQNGIEL